MKFYNLRNKSGILVLLCLFLFSLILRLSFLNAGLFHHDSVQLAMAVEKSADEVIIHPVGGGRHGLVIVDTILFYFLSAFFGHSSAEFAVNFSSAFFGALAIPLLYLFAKEITNGTRTIGVLYSTSNYSNFCSA